jgi:hypothetical protein
MFLFLRNFIKKKYIKFINLISGDNYFNQKLKKKGENL